MSSDKRNFHVPEAVYWWKPSAWLRVAGTDALNFLQGQFSNDLRGAADGRAVYGLWLDHKGKVLADSFVGQTETGFWIASYGSPAADLCARFEAYIVADDVTVTDETSAVTAVTLFGLEPRDVAAALPTGTVTFSGRRSGSPCAEVVMPAASELRVRELFAGAPELTPSQVEQRRIDAAIPAVPRDIGPADLPQEAGLERDAVSFTKGCYLGQEVMARLNSMGQVRRSLLRVRSDGACPPLPAALFQDGKKIGELRSAVAAERGFTGLALLTVMSLRRDEALTFAPESGSGNVWVKPST